MPMTPEEAKKKYLERETPKIAEITKLIDDEMVAKYTPGKALPVEFPSAPLTDAMMEELRAQYPNWLIEQGRTRGDNPPKTRLTFSDAEVVAERAKREAAKSPKAPASAEAGPEKAKE